MIRSGHNEPSKYKCWKLFRATLTSNGQSQQRINLKLSKCNAIHKETDRSYQRTNKQTNKQEIRNEIITGSWYLSGTISKFPTSTTVFFVWGYPLPLPPPPHRGSLGPYMCVSWVQLGFAYYRNKDFLSCLAQ